MPWRWQICITKFLFSYKDDLTASFNQTTTQWHKKSTSGWRPSSLLIFCKLLQLIPGVNIFYAKWSWHDVCFWISALVWRSAPPAQLLYLKAKKAPRDFIGLNKAAVQAGLTTAQEHFQYRATHDMRRKDSGNEKTSLKVKRIPPTMVFGIPTK